VEPGLSCPSSLVLGMAGRGSKALLPCARITNACFDKVHPLLRRTLGILHFVSGSLGGAKWSMYACTIPQVACAPPSHVPDSWPNCAATSDRSQLKQQGLLLAGLQYALGFKTEHHVCLWTMSCCGGPGCWFVGEMG